MTIFYLDIECDDLKGTTLIQVSCISENNKIFNGFCDVPHLLSAHCKNITGFFTYKNRLFQHGKELETSPKTKVLKAFSDWLSKNSSGPIYLIAHNGFGYDYRILFQHYSSCNLSFNTDVLFCDSLSSIKKLYGSTYNSYSLSALTLHFDIPNPLEHNGLADSITLKKICDKIILEKQLPQAFFTTKFKTQAQINFNGRRKNKSPHARE